MSQTFQKYWQEVAKWAEGIIPHIFGAVLILALGWWLSNQLVRLMRRGMLRSRTDTGIITFLCSLTRALLKIVVCITAAAELGMNVTSIIATLGAAGVTIGLAMQASLSNIASGAQIIFTKPFRVGDYLALQDVEGTVERLEIMFTVLRTFDNKEIVIPNSQVTAGVITNYSAMETRRLDLNYTVAYEADIAAVKQLLAELVRQNSRAMNDPSPLIVVGEHGESAVNIAVKVWWKTEDYWPLYFEMQEQVKLAFDKAGIVIPFRQLDVHMNTVE
ncbi:MAG: mechanosensitive ion channel [Clostridiales bacterium]|nr:mechanosensitive ion channel [Clostridiales bacterium]